MKLIRITIRTSRKAKEALSIVLQKTRSILADKTVQGLLLFWIVARVEGLHIKLNTTMEYLNNIFITIAINFIGWQEQIRALINSVVSLFGGEGV